MNKKILTLSILFILILSIGGCEKEISFDSTKDQSSLALVVEKKSDYELSWKIPPELIKKGWKNLETVKQYFQNDQGSFFSQGKKIEFPSFKGFNSCTGTASECNKEAEYRSIFIPNKDEQDVVAHYILEQDSYDFTQKGSNGILDETKPVSLQKKGKNIFSACVFLGDGSLPVFRMRLIRNTLSFDFLEHSCDLPYEKIANSHPNIFYDKETMNEKYHLEGSKYLFAYQGKLGFIAKNNEKEYIFFDGKRISTLYDEILTSFDTDLEVYDNGALIFPARNGKDYYVTQINLNALQ